MEKEDVLLAYIEYLISLVKRADETVVIQSDDRILEGFRYEKEVEHFLKTAVDKDLFEVYYQPGILGQRKIVILLSKLEQAEASLYGNDPAGCVYQYCRKAGAHRTDRTASVQKGVPFY